MPDHTAKKIGSNKSQTLQTEREMHGMQLRSSKNMMILRSGRVLKPQTTPIKKRQSLLLRKSPTKSTGFVTPIKRNKLRPLIVGKAAYCNICKSAQCKILPISVDFTPFPLKLAPMTPALERTPTLILTASAA